MTRAARLARVPSQNANSPTYSGRVSVIASTSPKYPQFFLPGTGAAGQATLINQSDNQVTVGSYRPFDAAGGSTDAGVTNEDIRGHRRLKTYS